MGKEYLGIIADQRINNRIDFSNIDNKQDYFKEVKNLLENQPDREGRLRGKNLLPYIDEMYELSNAKEKVESQNSYNEAVKFQKKRGRKGLIDQRKTARDTRKPTRKSVRRWKKKPSRSDILGVDTKTTVKKLPLITGREKILKRKGIYVSVNSRGIKQYRDLKTGRFIKKPI